MTAKSSFANARVLVTGGTGFVGSHLVEKLVSEGADVVSTYQTLQPNSYFAQKKLDKKVTLTQVNVSDFTALHHTITKFDIQYIFHLAAQPLVEVAYYNPRQTLETNILGTVNVLESARLYPRVKAVIVASSDKAYGKLKSGKYTEEHALRGDHPYEVSKSATDLITLMYAKTYNVPAVVTRFGNIYGPGDMNFSRIVPGIMQTLVNGETLELRSTGKFIRDYLHVTDVVNGYLVLAQKIEAAKGQAFNFGSKDTHSVLELIGIVEKTLGKEVPYIVKNTARNEISYQSLDYRKAVKELGWQPEQTLKSSLFDIFLYYYKIAKNEEI